MTAGRIVQPTYRIRDGVPVVLLYGRLETGVPCRLYTDEIRCPIARGTLCDALLELAASGFGGPLNVAGPTPLSRHDFGLRLLRHFGSLSAVREASLEDLCAVPGLPRSVAERVFRDLRS